MYPFWEHEPRTLYTQPCNQMPPCMMQALTQSSLGATSFPQAAPVLLRHRSRSVTSKSTTQGSCNSQGLSSGMSGAIFAYPFILTAFILAPMRIRTHAGRNNLKEPSPVFAKIMTGAQSTEAHWSGPPCPRMSMLVDMRYATSCKKNDQT